MTVMNFMYRTATLTLFRLGVWRIGHSIFHKKCLTEIKKYVVHVDSTGSCRRNTRMLAVATRKCYLLHVSVGSV